MSDTDSRVNDEVAGPPLCQHFVSKSPRSRVAVNLGESTFAGCNALERTPTHMVERLINHATWTLRSPRIGTIGRLIQTTSKHLPVARRCKVGNASRHRESVDRPSRCATEYFGADEVRSISVPRIDHFRADAELDRGAGLCLVDSRLDYRPGTASLRARRELRTHSSNCSHSVRYAKSKKMHLHRWYHKLRNTLPVSMCSGS